MVMVEIDSNAILVEPLKSRKDAELTRAYHVLVLRLKNAGIVPRKHVLDNEVSSTMKAVFRDKYKMEMELVPPGCHRRNAAEVAIRNFKAHFLSVLAGVADDFPLALWDRLLPQTEITLNLLRQSNATPTVSAHAHFRGLSITTKRQSHQWVVRLRSTRRPTIAAHGIIIPLTDGTFSPQRTIIARTIATSKVQEANDSPTPCTYNTSTSQIHRSVTPIK